MGRIRQLLGLTETTTVTESTELAAVNNHVEILQESIADLELALEDQGWQRLLGNADNEFSREGLRRASALARLMSIQNPLVRRAIAVRTAYVWGQGLSIEARATGDDGDQDVNAVIQEFLDDPLNRRALTGDEAQERNERSLATDGQVFIALVTSPLSGRVQPRTIPFDEIDDVISNLEDRTDVWFYKRQYIVDLPSGGTETRVEMYPDLLHKPRQRPTALGGHRIHWDKPVLHIGVNRLDGWKFGIGDAYPALAWARAYSDFLGDWATLVKALSQFAWKATGKGSKAQKMRDALNAAPATDAVGRPLTVGATVAMDPSMSLEAIPKSGATIDSESGKPLASMVASSFDIPVTMLLGDPGQSGARAVAETLDKPTELAMGQRRTVWANAWRSMFDHIIDSSVRAPRGALKGTIKRDLETGREIVTLAGDTDRTVDIVWPDLSTTPVGDLVEAIVKADSTQRMPAELVLRLLLQALGVDDVDEIVDSMLDDDGNFIEPTATAADVAVQKYHDGEDPADQLGG